MFEKAREVAQWLLRDCNCSTATPLVVEIKGTQYPGAHYTQPRTPLPGARSQEPYTHEAIYLLGPLPYCYRHTPNLTVFRLNSGNTLYYVGSHTTPACLEEPYAEFHPFGLSFQLMPDAIGVIDPEYRTIVEGLLTYD